MESSVKDCEYREAPNDLFSKGLHVRFVHNWWRHLPAILRSQEFSWSRTVDFKRAPRAITTVNNNIVIGSKRKENLYFETKWEYVFVESSTRITKILCPRRITVSPRSPLTLYELAFQFVKRKHCKILINIPVRPLLDLLLTERCLLYPIFNSTTLTPFSLYQRRFMDFNTLTIAVFVF